MAEQTAPPKPGVYSPLTWRARRLVSQLRRATHLSVQQAILAELAHEIAKRSRKQSGLLKAWLRKRRRTLAARAAKAVSKRARAVAHTVRYGAQMRCTCGRQFHNRLQFAAHARAHQREARQPVRSVPRQPGERQTVYRRRLDAGKPERVTAQQHSRDVLGAVHPEHARTAVRAARNGTPLGKSDLKTMAQNMKAASQASRQPPAQPASNGRRYSAPAASRSTTPGRGGTGRSMVEDPKAPAPRTPRPAATRTPVRTPAPKTPAPKAPRVSRT